MLQRLGSLYDQSSVKQLKKAMRITTHDNPVNTEQLIISYCFPASGRQHVLIRILGRSVRIQRRPYLYLNTARIQ